MESTWLVNVAIFGLSIHSDDNHMIEPRLSD